jgi:uncharacterized protein YycO
MLNVGDILFSYNKLNPFSYIIWKISDVLSSIRGKSKEGLHRTSHTAIYIGDGKLIEASYFGVKIGDSDKYDASRYVKEYGSCNVEFDVAKLVNSCNMKAGNVDYAYWQVLFILVKNILNKFQFDLLQSNQDIQSDAQTCSEFVAYEFKGVGVDLVPSKHPANVTPVDVYNSDKIDCRLER